MNLSFRMVVRLTSIQILGMVLLSCSEELPTELEPRPEIERDPTEFVEYREGNIPIIISVPHGGTEAPFWIPSRSCPDISTVRDEFTFELSDSILEAFLSFNDAIPYIVRTTLSRSKVDFNREREEATCNNEMAGVAYDFYHDSIENAKKEVVEKFGRGLLLDIHGHGHEIQRVEIGYLLIRSELNATDSVLNSATVLQESSIRQLAFDNVVNSSHASLVRGSFSLGALLFSSGFPAIPSPQFPAPNTNEPYFSGGFITRAHGSQSENGIDAIQLECNRDGLRDTPENRLSFAQALVESSTTYLKTLYGFEL